MSISMGSKPRKKKNRIETWIHKDKAKLIKKKVPQIKEKVKE